MRLSLGVENVGYSDPGAPGAVTTSQVAEFLEKRYHVMEVFFELYKPKIADELCASIAERIESLMQGNPHMQRIEDAPLSEIEKMFQQYLDRDEWQRTTGQTILAAKRGISHRKKMKRRKGPRSAFIDTGTFQKWFRARLGK